jgi:hypothetical protein
MFAAYLLFLPFPKLFLVSETWFCTNHQEKKHPGNYVSETSNYVSESEKSFGNVVLYESSRKKHYGNYVSETEKSFGNATNHVSEHSLFHRFRNFF